MLRFDGHEPRARPLDVDELLATGEISMCEGGQKRRSACQPVRGGGDLQTGFDHLAFDTETLATAPVATRIYVHATRASADGSADRAASRIYLDYWWYLPDNPARAGSGAFCGPALDIGGATCFDHRSD